MKAVAAALRDGLRDRRAQENLALVRRLRRLYPGHELLNTLCARTFEMAGQGLEAVAAYKHVLRLNAANETALHGILAICLQSGKYGLARRLLAGRLHNAVAAKTEIARARLALHDRDLRAANKAIETARRAGAVEAHLVPLSEAADRLARSQASTFSYAFRHIAIGGVSFCGSTTLSALLGSIPGVFNIGESHHIIQQIDLRQVGHPAHQLMGGELFDWKHGDPALLFPCATCGPRCRVFDNAFREELARDDTDWYGRIAEQANARVLVSSDKNHGTLARLDPQGRYDLIVLYKSPLGAWRSILKNKERLAAIAFDHPDLHRGIPQYLTLWSSAYLKLLHALHPQGRVIALNWESYCLDPQAHMARLLALLKLKADASPALKADQHFFGGNLDVRADLKAVESIRSPAQTPVPPDDMAEITGHTPSQHVFRLLESRYRRDFSAMSEGPVA